VLALGNPDRGDDGAGPAVAARLLELLGDRIGSDRPDAIDLRQIPGEATEILAAWEGAESVIVIDAVRTDVRDGHEGQGAGIGTIHRLTAADLLPLPPSPGEAPADPPPGGSKAFRSPSSHGFGLAEALALGKTLGRLPPTLVIYGIEAGSFSPGAPLHPEVERAAEELARRLVDELPARDSTSPTPCGAG